MSEIFPNEIVLHIKAPIRVVIVSFYKNDNKVNEFIRIFKENLADSSMLYKEKKCSTFKEAYEYFEKIEKKRADYSVVLIVTHGTKKGQPTFEEYNNERNNPFVNNVLETWFFTKKCFKQALVDKLSLIAVCYAGKAKEVRELETGYVQNLHTLTAFPENSLGVVNGAKAMAQFLNYLKDMSVSKYNENHLKEAFKRLDHDYQNILKLWIYGDAGEEIGDNDFLNNLLLGDNNDN